ncbi:chitobiase/beta-hexosaminidase C-terminal domain-containing protein [Mitsuaria sp. WAJ17]|uniref:beta-1,3-glucanase family protein n=1 Tax=Mitsuaria sp. WAJ17 TaxID=2761452 RepID=UPI0016041C07|nr:beta-1,3-glucanase family protein [Mitsuaria sp. WAJ17]MBB2487537.1 chitobiase/beta-hexosaminidase C-terminal domain-containing protein [Mitsuaria sp. WAJ17]
MTHTFLGLIGRLLCAVLALSLGLLPHASRAAEFTAGAELSGSTATLWFKPALSSSWVDAHYSLAGGAQMNVRMSYNSSAARFETSFPASAGQTLTHSFTYFTGGAAYDTAVGSTLLQGGGGGAPAAPGFSVPSGSYTAPLSINLSSSSSGASIRYTLDGSTPTAASATYTTTLTLNASATVKAIALLNGQSSAVSSASYTLTTGGGSGYTQGVDYTGGVATFWFARELAATAWVDVHFDAGSGQQNVRSSYNSSTQRFEHKTALPAGATVKYSFTWFANGSGAADSPLFVLTLGGGGGGGGTAAAPTFSVPAGTYTSAQQISLASSTPGAVIRYTIDGSTPSAASPAYAAPIPVGRSLTIKAYASASGLADSSVSSAGYTINIVGGAFSQGVSELGTTATVWFKPTAAQSFVILHYQVGTGSQINPQMAYNPTLGRYETVLSGLQPGQRIGYAFTYAPVSGTQTDSPAYSYVMGTGNDIPRPAFSPAGGSYASPVSVSLSTQAAGGVIRYTTDGSAPNALSPQYTGPITVNTAMTLNAISVLGDGSQSGIASSTYVVGTPGGQVAAPVFSHAAGSYDSPIQLTLASGTVGATIRFTTDGSTPGAGSPAYGGPIPLAGPTTVRAIAFKPGMTASALSQASYAIGGGGGQVWNGQTTFRLVNATRGRFSDAQVYWAIIGKDWATDQFVHVNAQGQLVPMSLGDNGALMKNGLPYSNYFFTLEQLKSVTIPPINSARILFSVGSPMYIWVNTDANGKIAYAGANIENPTDPNIDVTFDFGEFAILPPGSNPQGIFVNTTRVDQFGFPVQLSVTGLDGFTQTVGESLTETRDELFAKFINDMPAPFHGLAQAPHAPFRIMAPAHASFQPGQANEHYLDDYIGAVWAQYSQQDLVLDLRNGWGSFRGRVSGNVMRFTDANGGVYLINGKPSTAMVMLGNGLLDDTSGGTTNAGKQLQLQAQLCAALNRRVAHLPFESWWDPAAHFPAGQPANHFARFWHEHSLNALAYGFAYDDVGSRSPSIHTRSPQTVTFTIGW